MPGNPWILRRDTLRVMRDAKNGSCRLRRTETICLLKKENDKISYEYDFGDGWLHDIVLEKILDPDPGVFYPQCVAGKRNCPPEDCGGPYGYSNFLKIIFNPRDKEYKEMIEWAGGKFDPESFDKEAINDLLKEDDFGTPSF